MRNTRKSIQRTILPVTLLCAMLGAMPAAWGQASKAGGAAAATAGMRKPIRTIDSIAAVVNKEVITKMELDERVLGVEQRIKAQGGASALPPRSELEKQVLESMIIESAQLQLAKEMGIQIDDAMLDRTIGRIAEQNKMSVQALRNQLERDGLAFAQFRETIREDIVRQRLREREVDNKIQISEAEVENHMAAQAGLLQTQSELSLAHILVRIPEKASSEQIAERYKRAEELRKKLTDGADFASLATTSSDATDAPKGGDLGWRTADRLPQLFLDAIENLKPGDVSKIVKSANGFHILKFVGKRLPSAVKADVAATAIQQTHARHILIKVNQVVSSLDAQRKLNDLKQRLDNKAAQFDDLAKLFSNDLSAAKGGDLGWIYPGDTVPEFERAMNALKVGEVSEPIESPFGYHLIQVLERKTADVSNERQRQQARMAIRERKLEEATQDWLRQLRDRAYVEYRLEEK